MNPLLLSCAKKKKIFSFYWRVGDFLLKTGTGTLGSDPSKAHLQFTKIVTSTGSFCRNEQVCPKAKMQLRILLFAENNMLTMWMWMNILTWLSHLYNSIFIFLWCVSHSRTHVDPPVQTECTYPWECGSESQSCFPWHELWMSGDITWNSFPTTILSAPWPVPSP